MILIRKVFQPPETYEKRTLYSSKGMKQSIKLKQSMKLKTWREIKMLWVGKELTLLIEWNFAANKPRLDVNI